MLTGADVPNKKVDDQMMQLLGDVQSQPVAVNAGAKALSAAVLALQTPSGAGGGKTKGVQAPRARSCMEADMESPTKSQSPVVASEEPPSPQQPTGSSSAKAKTKATPRPKQQPGGAGNGDKAETRGRKARNLDSDMAKYEHQFQSAPDCDPIFWGAECKVGQRMFEEINKAIPARYKKALRKASGRC